MKIIILVFIGMIGGYIGIEIFGDIPIVNWICGAIIGTINGTLTINK